MLLASVLRDGGLLTYKEDKIEHEAGKQPDGSGRLYSGDFTPVGAGGKAVSYPSLYSSRTYSHSCCFGRRMAGSGFPWAVTVLEALAGILISLILALALGILMDRFPAVQRGIYPLLVVTQTVPMIVLAPILIIYMGFGPGPKILTVVLMCFFPVAVSFSDGLSRVDEEYVHLVRSYGAGKWGAYRLVKIPAALPALLSGLKVAATYSISGAVVGEWIGSQQGLGYYLLRVKNGYMLDKVFACVAVIIGLSLCVNGAVRLLGRICLPYERKRRK